MKNLFDKLLSLLFPEKCPACGRLVGERESGFSICDDCLAVLEKSFSPERVFRDAFSGEGGIDIIGYAVSLYPYGGRELIKLIFSVKNYGNRSAVRYFAAHAASVINDDLLLSSCDVISWIPRRKSAERKSGCDQSRLYAGEISRLCGMRCDRLLFRRHGGRAQKLLSLDERVENLKGAFRADEKAQAKRVLLIDDVITTGSSVREGALALLDAGAENVFVLSVSDGRKHASQVGGT